MAIILQTKIDYVDKSPTTGLYPIPAMTAGYAIFASGITTGWANLACGCVQLPLRLRLFLKLLFSSCVSCDPT